MPEKKGIRDRQSIIQNFHEYVLISMVFLFISLERSTFNRVRKTKRGIKNIFSTYKVWRLHDGLFFEESLRAIISNESRSNEIEYSLCKASEAASFDNL
jgi:hypothetical protein